MATHHPLRIDLRQQGAPPSNRDQGAQRDARSRRLRTYLHPVARRIANQPRLTQVNAGSRRWQETRT